MWRILKYSVYDLVRSKWIAIYCAFFFLLTLVLILLSGDLSKVVISLMNVIVVLVPLIASIFGIMYYYNSREFTELLLAQPIPRTHIFLGQAIGVGASLSASAVVGFGLPFVIYGILSTTEIWNYLVLLAIAVALTFIFSSLSYLIGLRHENRLRGFGTAILLWLFFAIIYDGVMLLLLSYFSAYPLEQFALGASLLNPIDLSRILILLKLDISALMGYTGAVFKKFFGTGLGAGLSSASLLLWILLPLFAIRMVSGRKDF